MTSIKPFFMFEGAAEAAIGFYASLFPDGKIVSMERYGADGQGKEGTVRLAVFKLADQTLMAIDSPAEHAFTFTPSVSLFVDCDSEAEFDRLFGALSEGGQVLMPAGAHGFSRKFGWCSDRFGVSWQLNWS